MFGVIWGLDAIIKLQTGFANSVLSIMQNVTQGQPAWLSGWFSFWSAQVASNPTPIAYSIIAIELLLSIALILGFMRKFAYTGGFFYSMFIWAVPEGFGGPYGAGSTDIGTGIIYAFAFLLLILLEIASTSNEWTLDSRIEKFWPKWKRVAEIKTSNDKTYSDVLEKTF
jgi:uncharacterized membrane protein YphA (DoxX/SURF4 family)